MERAVQELIIFSAMAGMGAATGGIRDVVLALLAFNGRRRRLTAGQAVSDLVFSLGAAAAVVATLWKLNSAAVRFYAVGGFGLGLWVYQLALGRWVQRGADRVRALPRDLVTRFRRPR